MEDFSKLRRKENETLDNIWSTTEIGEGKILKYNYYFEKKLILFFFKKKF